MEGRGHALISGHKHVFALCSIRVQEVFIRPCNPQSLILPTAAEHSQLPLQSHDSMMIRQDVVSEEIDLGAKMCNAGWKVINIDQEQQ